MTQSDENFLVIESTVEHPIYPARASQLHRNVILKGDLDVKGGIYCNNLRAEGQVRVHGPVLVKEEIELSPPEQLNQTMIFRQGINALRALSVKLSDLRPYSPVSQKDYTPLIFNGNVCAPAVRLENTVLLGNVISDNALLKDCIILGSPIIKESLILENCLVISFQAGSVRFRGRNTLLVPYGISRSPILAEHFEDVSRDEDDDVGFHDVPGEESGEAEGDSYQSPTFDPVLPDAYRAWVRYIGFCGLERHGCGERIVSCTEHYNGTCKYSDVRLEPEDVLVTQDADGQPIWMLTLAHRIISLTQIEDDLARLKQFMKTIQTMDHMEDSARESTLQLLEQNFHPEESHILRILHDLALPSSNHER